MDENMLLQQVHLAKVICKGQWIVKSDLRQLLLFLLLNKRKKSYNDTITKFLQRQYKMGLLIPWITFVR